VNFWFVNYVKILIAIATQINTFSQWHKSKANSWVANHFGERKADNLEYVYAPDAFTGLEEIPPSLPDFISSFFPEWRNLTAAIRCLGTVPCDACLNILAHLLGRGSIPLA